MSVAEGEIEFEVGMGAAQPTPFTSQVLQTRCEAGHVLDSLGRCVINPTVDCEVGFESINGKCVAITSQNAKGRLIRVERPATVDASARFYINAVYRNTGTNTGRFGAHVKIPTLGYLDILSEFHDVKPNEIGVISVQLQAHDLPYEGTYPHSGIVELVRALKDNNGKDLGLTIDGSLAFTFEVIKFSGPR